MLTKILTHSCVRQTVLQRLFNLSLVFFVFFFLGIHPKLSKRLVLHVLLTQSHLEMWKMIRV